MDNFKDESVKAVTKEQKKAMFSFLSGRDTFVCLPTGYGKSLIYQVALLIAKRLSEARSEDVSSLAQSDSTSGLKIPSNPMVLLVSPSKFLDH